MHYKNPNNIKKLLLIILTTTSISIQISAQEFAPIGAKWHYSQGTANPELISFKTIESLSDTMINGIACRKLMEISRYSITPDTTFLFMYSNNDSVLFFKESNFYLLYNFGAVAGDTLTLGNFTTYNGLPLKMVIDSISTITINSQSKRLQYVTCGDGMVIEFGGIVIESIGNTAYMFPLFDMYVDGPLRCYEDSNLGLFISPYHSNNGWDFQNCEQNITGINYLGAIKGIMAYPNPATYSFAIKNIDRPTVFQLFDTQGRPIKSGKVEPMQLINIDDLPRGLYFLELQNSKLLSITKIVKE